MTIREVWQEEIVARQALDAASLVSAISNRLYPDISYGPDREKKLMEIPEMKRLRDIAMAECAACHRELIEWRNRNV